MQKCLHLCQGAASRRGSYKRPRRSGKTAARRGIEAQDAGFEQPTEQAVLGDPPVAVCFGKVTHGPCLRQLPHLSEAL